LSTPTRLNLLKDGALDLATLRAISEQPAVWTPGEPRFWDDPHIATQMLKAHLDPEMEAASRRPEQIDRTVDWFIDGLGLAAGMSLIDLGCGPGLYAAKLAARGLAVTGVDISENSLNYARKFAAEHDLSITYLRRDFREIDYDGEFEVVMQIFGELSVFRPPVRDDILRRAYRALVPGGRLIFDVSTPSVRRWAAVDNSWGTLDGGFWRADPYLVLRDGFQYADNIRCDQYIVIEQSGDATIYRNWFHDYRPETLTPVVEAAGFRVQTLTSDLAGTPYQDGDDWLGIVAVKDA
jgi:SAM-dependent methyltransferase